MLPKLKRILPLIPFLLVLASHVTCELFTAQVELEPLFTTQSSLVEAFEGYLAREEMRLKEIRRRLEPYAERGQRDHEEVLQNPISSFLLVKGLTLDLEDLITIVDRKQNALELGTKIADMKQKFKFPNHEDLTGAAQAITRLQETYLLEPKEMAEGCIVGKSCTLKLSCKYPFT